MPPDSLEDSAAKHAAMCRSMQPDTVAAARSYNIKGGDKQVVLMQMVGDESFKSNHVCDPVP